MSRLPPVPMVARILLLSLAAGAVLLAWRPAPGGSVEAGRPAYVCPMHPLSTSPAPGTCAVCGMELVLQGSQSVLGPPAGVERLRSRVLQVQPRAWASVDAEGRMVGVLYIDELAVVPAGSEGVFRGPALPPEGIPVRRTDAPPVPRDASTSAVEFRSMVPGRTPAPGSVGWIELPVRSAAALVVPSGAVLQSPDGPFVLVQDADGSGLSRRPVTVGRSSFGMTVVVSGLSESDRVAVRGVPFLDAEQALATSGRR